MTSYSEIIQVMAAMVIFSMVLLNANRLIHRNNILQIEAELEQEVVSIGQEIIDEALSRSYDQVTVNAAAPPSLIPEGFSSPSALGPDPSETGRALFNDFDDYHGWSDQVTTEHGTFQRSVEVYYVDAVVSGQQISFVPASGPSTFKKIDVLVTSQYLTDKQGDPVVYKLEFVRNYYAD